MAKRTRQNCQIYFHELIKSTILEIRALSQNSTFHQFVKVYLAILPCSFFHVYGNIIDLPGYIPGRDFLVSAGKSNRVFRYLFTSWFISFQVYRDVLLNILHSKNSKRKDSNSHHSAYAGSESQTQNLQMLPRKK